jgi:hypothetical protein
MLFPHGALDEGGKRGHAVRLIALFFLTQFWNYGEDQPVTKCRKSVFFYMLL